MGSDTESGVVGRLLEREGAYCPDHKGWNRYKDPGEDCPRGSCEATLRERPPASRQLLEKVKTTVVAAILLLLFAGPPIYAVASNLGDPLYATRTVTTTHTIPYGFIPEAGQILIPWFVIWLVFYGMATGAFPRP